MGQLLNRRWLVYGGGLLTGNGLFGVKICIYSYDYESFACICAQQCFLVCVDYLERKFQLNSSPRTKESYLANRRDRGTSICEDDSFG